MSDARRKILDEDLQQLDDRIRSSKRLILGFGLVLPLSYFSWFIYNSIPISVNSGDWGTLGDFIGGILNPIIAFSAFYWLTKSVRIQKEELVETRATLDDTLAAQSAQIKISAYTALINSATSEIDVLNTRLTYLCDQFKKSEVTGILDLQGEWLGIDAAKAGIANLNSDISAQLQRKFDLEKNIQNLLQKEFSDRSFS